MATVRPTFSESWYRVADLKARLRPSAQISRQHYRGDRWYVVRDPAGNQFHRLSAPAYRFVGLLDGSRTVSQAWDLVGGQLADEAPTQNEVIQILSQLHSANLLESDVTPDAAVLLRRHKKMVRQQWQSRFMNILFPRIPLWDPDLFLQRWMPFMKHVIGPIGTIVWLLVVGAAIFKLAPEWPRLQESAKNAIDPTNWPFLWATFCIVKLIHELGHAFMCRRFGGEVHELGIMFLVLMPAPYVDASTAWAFPSRWHRMLVGMGGMIFELFVASIMAFVWLNSQPGHLINQLAYNAMLIASVSTVIFNANPLLRYDGYYILSDWLEIPNLRYKSTEYTMGILKRHLFRVKMHQPLPPVGQRVWLFLYAICSTIYRTMVGIAIIMMVWFQVPVLGVLMALGGVATWLLVPVIKTSKYLLIDPELHRKRTRATAWTLAGVALAVLIIGVFPSPLGTHFETMGIVEPVNRKIVYSRVGGTAKVLVKDGEQVAAGQPLIELDDPQLLAQIAALEARLRGLDAQLARGVAKDQSEKRMAEEQIGAVRKDLAESMKKREELKVRSPMAGQVVAPEIRHLEGRYLRPNSEIAQVVDLSQLRITALVDQDDAAMPFRRKEGFKENFVDVQVRPVARIADKPISVKLDPNRIPTLVTEAPHPSLTDLAQGPAALDHTDAEGKRLMRPQNSIWLTLPPPTEPGKALLTGERVHIRFTVPNETLAWQWKRRIWQVIQSHSNSKWN